ncbi:MULTISPECIES: hypothetical protein [Staphylococcus]|uniref:Maebl n=1 Tax=Staphylococcus pettenkoferi TaxID=170573 RepID=A0A2N6QIZ0_9STAP|nr:MULTISPECIES: hypothetical protein [Staphylococcus]MCI2790665.1 hypothetical protein [Staphylococcus pettenkoferi]OFK75768.1 hypothetical protein HMPREF2802_04175 [Staphylococcus sp. HMSC071G07]PMC19564.1 hypothetical protein CJ235_04170 [Staphylococcus pettenkoferi]
MQHYNRDDYERGEQDFTMRPHTSRYQPNNFVFGFVFGTVIGSAIGLFANNKAKKKKQVPQEEVQFDQHLHETTRQEQALAEDQVETIKGRIGHAYNADQTPSSDELSAQQAAIQQESSDHQLSDTSPVGQENILSERETTDSDLENIDETETPSQQELNAQQAAIQLEEEEKNDALHQVDKDQHSPAQRLAQASQQKHAQLQEDKTVAQRTDALLASPGIASPRKDFKVPNLLGQSSGSAELARAAKDKKQAMNTNSKVAEQTRQLFADAPIASPGQSFKVPHLTGGQDATIKGQSLAKAAKDKQARMKQDTKVATRTEALMTETPITKVAKPYIVPALTAESIDKAPSYAKAVVAYTKAQKAAKKQGQNKKTQASQKSTSNNKKAAATTKKASTSKAKNTKKTSTSSNKSQQTTAKKKTASAQKKSNAKGTKSQSKSSSKKQNVTKPKDAKKSAPQTHSKASFDNGHIQHDKADKSSKQSKNNIASATESSTVDTTKDQQSVPSYNNKSNNTKGKKTKSKIEKRTFDDK